MSLFLIILAAGDGKRFKSNTPKPYNKVGNKTLLEHSINEFRNFNQIKKTVIVYNKKHKRHLNKLNLKNILKIAGGKSRQESTFIALKNIKNMNCKKVLIHDSARPFPSKKIIGKIQSARVDNFKGGLRRIKSPYLSVKKLYISFLFFIGPFISGNSLI